MFRQVLTLIMSEIRLMSGYKESVYVMSEEIKSMKIQTRDFGEQEIALEDIITFPNGLFAFEDARRFVLMSPLGDEASPMWLQSAEGSSPCFIVFKPTELFDNYIPELSEEDMKVLKLEDNDVLEYLVIAVIPEDYKQTTVNLKSPIIINRNKKIAIQTILQQSFSLKHPIYQTAEGA